MIRPANEGIEVWLCVEPVDFRKQITGLATLVQDALAMDPFSTQLFVFTNRRRTQCRILYWEKCGFVLWQKRLERARFAWPRRADAVVNLSGAQLNFLLDGYDISGEDGRYGIDTNPIENAIRDSSVRRLAPQLAIRRPWPAPTPAHGSLNAYLRHVFTALPKAQSLAEVEALLPTRLDPAALAPDSLQESFLAARQQRRFRGAYGVHQAWRSSSCLHSLRPPGYPSIQSGASIRGTMGLFIFLR